MTPACAPRTQTVPGRRTGYTPGAAYNSRIPRMHSPLTSRLLFWVFVLALFSAPAKAQNWTGAEEQLAGKIVSATGPKTMALEVVNRSSLSGATTDDIRRNLLTQLAVLGVRFVAAEQASVNVRVSLSDNLQSYIWVAEIRQCTNPTSIVMVTLPRTGPVPVERQATAMMLQKISLWSQPERILDVAVIDGNPARMLVLDTNGVTPYRIQNSHWQPEPLLPIAHLRPWPRDLRGRLVPGGDKNPLFVDVYMPGVHCRTSTSTPPAMTCNESDEPWPVGPVFPALNASFTPARNYFGGALSPGVGKLTTAPPFYSAAPVPRDQVTWWLLASVSGQVHLLDGVTDQVIEKLAWGSDIASVRSGCGLGWQTLAAGSGQGRSDSMQAFEVSGREPVAVSASLEMGGAITALWTESGSTSAVAVVHNLETGRYEANRITLSCGR